MVASSRASTSTPRVLIIGSGFAGLCAAIRMKQAGIHSFVVLEKDGGVGGTWRVNDYPGAACDVQSHLYSFSFERNPRWSRMFAEQKEIRAYLEHCVDKYELGDHLRFNAEVTGARYDEARSEWTVTLADGETLTADLVISGTGGLSRPAYPDIPGLASFQGKLFHSARWDHGHDLRNRKIGVIGTGASAIQFVPQIAPLAHKLSLFQRTPPWILPKPDRAIGPAERWLYRFAPFLQWLYRIVLYWLLELRVLGLVVHRKLMALPQRFALRYLEQSVADPALRAKLTPKYTMGCKRVLMSNDYFQAVTRDNVELVDTGIREIVPNGVVTRDGRLHEVDTIILGTGFQAADATAPFPVFGRGGVSLDDQWKDGAEAYLGTCVAGFPNWFFIVGPNTGLGHSSMVLMIESQVNHVMQCIAHLRKKAAAAIEVRAEAQRSYNERIQAKLARTVWASGCMSWYQTSSGKNTTLWPSFTFTFRRLTARLDPRAYAFTPPRVDAVESSRSRALPLPALKPASPVTAAAE